MPDSPLLNTRPNEDYVRTFPRYWEEFDATTGEAAGAAFMNSLTMPGSLASIARQADYATKDGALSSLKSLSPTLTPEEANQRAEPLGMKFDKPIREDALTARLDQRKRVLARQSVIDRAPDSLGKTAAVAGNTLLGAVADPLNLALAFVPIVGEARFAQLSATLGSRGLARVATGAIEGAAGNALIEPLAFGIAHNEQQDYTMYDSLTNIALGGVIGGGLHFAGGMARDAMGAERVNKDAFVKGFELTMPERIESAHPLTKEFALRTAVSDLTEGRAVDVSPHFEVDGRYLNPTSDKNLSVAGGADAMYPTGTLERDQAPSTHSTLSKPPSGVFLKENKPPSILRGEISYNSDIKDTPSTKLYHRVDDLEKIYSKAEKSIGDLQAKLKWISQQVQGVEFIGARVKDRTTMKEKLAYMGRKPSQVSDYLGGRVSARTKGDIVETLDRLQKTADIMEVDDFLDVPKPGGYRGVHVQIKGKNGISAEVQILPEPVALIKDEADKIYAKWRRKDMHSLTPEQAAEFKADFARAEKMFSDAWDKFNASRPPETRGAAPNFKEIARRFAEEKNKPSALTREMDGHPATETMIREDLIGPELKDIEAAITDAKTMLDEIKGLQDSADPEILKALGADKETIAKELKGLDADLKEAKTMSDAVRMFTNCMLRG